MLIKQFGHIEKASKLQDGEVEFIVSTNAWDAHGERINVDGISYKDFMKNPVVLWGHNGFDLPIAKATKVWKDGNKLMARAKFYLADDFARKVYGYIIDGFLNAVSIGGMVEQWGEDGLTIEKLNMKEFSVVTIPANQEALVASKSLSGEQRTELESLARVTAVKMLSGDSENKLQKDIKSLKSLVATLEEVADTSETEDVQAKDINQRVVLKQAQAVDKHVEKIIVQLKGQN